MATPQDQLADAAPPQRGIQVPKTVSRRVKVIDRAADLTIRVFGAGVIARE